MALKSLTQWVVAGTVLVAGACAPVSQAAPVVARNTAPTPYDAKDAEKVIGFGYGVIRDRYLSDVTVGGVALEGLRGLNRIDPALGAKRAGDRLRMTAGGATIAEYPAPAEDDVEAWAHLTVAAALDARTSSAKLKTLGGESLYEVVFEATLAKLDPFSRYSSAKEAREHRASRNGFGGIGIRFELVDQKIVITDVMAESPAGRAGIRNGDVLAYIDGIPVDSLDREEVSKRLRGSIGSDVTLSLQPKEAGGVSQVTLRRTLVVPPTVTTKVEDGIATFKVSGFNQRTATSLTDSLRQVQGKMGDGLKGVVLDLRGNPGGLLDQAVGVADLFMPSGRIVWTKGRHPLASQSYDAKPGDIGEKVPLVVLIDGKSASASEIVAAALQDSGRAVVVGTNSYGKGTVQTVIRMPNDGEMTLTWSRFHSPSGYALHGLGVLPTLCTANEQVPETTLIADVREGTSKVGLQLAAWRTSDINRVEERKQLRTSCPSAKHAENVMDSDLGRRLLVDQGLYNRALSLNEITMAAHASLH